MRITRLLGLRKIFNNTHFSSCIVLKKTEKYSITSKAWYDFCGLRNFSEISIKMSIEIPVAGESAESVSEIISNYFGNGTFFHNTFFSNIAI